MEHPSALPLLPPEIWIYLIRQLRPLPKEEGIQDLQNLSLASHNSQELARPYIFERISFLNPSNTAIDRIEGLSLFLKSDPRRRKWPKVLLVTYQPGWAVRVVPAILQFFTSLTDWRFVRMVNISLSVDVYRHLYCLPDLRTFYGPPPNHQNEDIIRDLSSETLPIQRLAVGAFVQWESNRLAAPAIARLALGPKLTHLDLINMDGPKLYSAISQITNDPGVIRCLHSLRYLSVEPPTRDFHLFYKFLDLFPNILHLSVDWMMVGTPLRRFPNSAKPPGALSHLESFEGPLPYAKILIPGSPVRNISLLIARGSWDDPSPIPIMHFKPLSESTAVVRSLQLSGVVWSTDLAPCFANLFPGLEDMTCAPIRADTPDSSDVLGPIVKASPHLLNLKFRPMYPVKHFPPDMQKAMLEEFRSQGAALRRASFEEGLNWARSDRDEWLESQTEALEEEKHFDWKESEYP